MSNDFYWDRISPSSGLLTNSTPFSMSFLEAAFALRDRTQMWAATEDYDHAGPNQGPKSYWFHFPTSLRFGTNFS